MDFSKLPKIRDEDRESVFGYVHGVSGPGECNFIWSLSRDQTQVFMKPMYQSIGLPLTLFFPSNCSFYLFASSLWPVLPDYNFWPSHYV